MSTAKGEHFSALVESVAVNIISHSVYDVRAKRVEIYRIFAIKLFLNLQVRCVAFYIYEVTIRVTYS